MLEHLKSDARKVCFCCKDFTLPCAEHDDVTHVMTPHRICTGSCPARYASEACRLLILRLNLLSLRSISACPPDNSGNHQHIATATAV
jgi:hypothetical protein